MVECRMNHKEGEKIKVERQTKIIHHIAGDLSFLLEEMGTP